MGSKWVKLNSLDLYRVINLDIVIDWLMQFVWIGTSDIKIRSFYNTVINIPDQNVSEEHETKLLLTSKKADMNNLLTNCCKG